MFVRLTRLVPVLLTLAALGWHAATPGFAAGTIPHAGKVVLQPADAQGNAIEGPGYFEVTAGAGTVQRMYALVGNVGHHAINVSVVPVDARSGVYGGISYNLPEQKRKQVGSWIRLSATQFKIHPDRAADIRFTVNVPAGTKPGQYVGGLTAFVPAAKSTSKQRGGSIVLQLRRIVAVVVTVPGNSFGRFSVLRVNPKQRPDAVYLIAHIRNSGTTLLKGHGYLWMWKVGVKKPVLTVPLSIDTTVPRSTVLYPVFWAKHPARATYRVKVTVSWDGGGQTSRHDKFTWSK